jgi:hypothetical protein
VNLSQYSNQLLKYVLKTFYELLTNFLWPSHKVPLNFWILTIFIKASQELLTSYILMKHKISKILQISYTLFIKLYEFLTNPYKIFTHILVTSYTFLMNLMLCFPCNIPKNLKDQTIVNFSSVKRRPHTKNARNMIHESVVDACICFFCQNCILFVSSKMLFFVKISCWNHLPWSIPTFIRWQTTGLHSREW